MSSLIVALHARRCALCMEDAITLIACGVGVGLASAKLFYLIFSVGIIPVFESIQRGDYSIFWDSGMVFYGGMLGGVAGAFLGAKIFKISLLDYEPVIVPCLPLGHAFGRLGCFLSGCCYGIAYDGPCSVVFPRFAIGTIPEVPVFPIQLLEMALNIGLFSVLIKYAKKDRPPYAVLGLYLSTYATLRFLLEYLRADSERGMYYFLSTSQWISLFLLIFCTGFGGTIWFRYKKSLNH